MRHHVAFKFIAILLCALSLLGAVGSAAGMLVLTELGLYDQTVDQMIEQSLQEHGQNYAQNLALRYASMNLGNCPEELTDRHVDSYWFGGFYSLDEIGYALLDAEGNVLEEWNPELKDGGKLYSYPVSGKYMYMVSQEPEYQDSGISTEVGPLGGEYGVYDQIPSTGVQIFGVTATYSNNSSEGVSSIDCLGYLHRMDNGSVIFQSYTPRVLDSIDEAEILHISFQDGAGTVVYEAAGASAVGDAYYSDQDYVTFVSHTAETIESSVNQVVYEAQIYNAHEPETVGFLIIGADPIAETEYDEYGRLHVYFRSIHDEDIKTSGSIINKSVAGIVLYNDLGEKVVDYHGLGELTVSANDYSLYYYSYEPVLKPTAVEVMSAAAAYTEPVEVSVPATVPEEVEATAEVTVPEAADEAGAAVPEEAAEPAEAAEEETAAEETVPEETEKTGETIAPTAVETEAPTVPETIVVTIPETVEVMIVPSSPEETEPVMVGGKLLSDYAYNTDTYYNSEIGREMRVQYIYTDMPEYTVELYVTEGAMEDAWRYDLLRVVRYFRSDLFLLLGVSLLVFAVSTVYLCCAAGHKPKTEEIHAGGLSRTPLDLNLAVTIAFVSTMAVCIVEGPGEYFLRKNLMMGCAMAVGLAFLASLSIVGFGYAAVAQFKTPEGYWLSNSLLGRFVTVSIRVMVWLEKWLTGKFFPWLGKTLKVIWKFSTRTVLAVWLFAERIIKKTAAWIGGVIRRFMELLPLTWQWILGGGLLLFLGLLVWANRNDGWGNLWLIVGIGFILYVAHCFGTLLESAKRMSKGDLDTKVDDKHMVGCFQEFAGELNDLADVAVVAAQKQLKSERMKTELITNVSHDIKTPLTSIINYVDLLQKPHTEEEGAAYLEVLERQSLRLKKLIEDLMDMSKASTGNMNVDITEVDAVECINQALGEFGDKLERAQLIPVFRHGEASVRMMADGRLVWRVLSNILGNAVKYAMPGTRLYIDLMELEGKVVISLKNISREELNLEAEELMERFVRGDDSRNTEGSGLGLNIAKSLMELQKGQLQLLVDGDLFKVTLIFPGV